MNSQKQVLLIVFTFTLIVMAPFQAALAAVVAPSLGTADSFAVLGNTTVTNTTTGSTIITGNLGVYPGTSVTGFPPGILVGGVIHAADGVAKDAQSDATAAYNVLYKMASDLPLTGQDLGGHKLLPGVYSFSSSAGLTGALTLDAQGDPNAVWVFKIGSTLTTASNSSVKLINGGQSNNVFWQVGSSATLGTSTTFTGTILAYASITLNTNTALFGRALAQTGAVTMDTNNVSTSCGAGVPLTSGVGALWQMLALPCVPTNATVASVFGTGTPSNLSTANYAASGIGWILEQRTVGNVPSYEPLLTPDLVLNVGTGYWIKSYQAPTNGILSMIGTTTPTDVTQAGGCASINGCKAITVTTMDGVNRYNLVANPFAYPVDWSKVRIRVDGSVSTLTPTEASTADYVSNIINIWDSTTYVSFNDVSPTWGNLQYFKSFWVNVLPGAARHTIELLIPAEASTLIRNQILTSSIEPLASIQLPRYMGWLDWVVSPVAAETESDRAVSNHVKPQPLANPKDWYIRLKVDNPVTGWKDHGNLLGQITDAQIGYDGHDVSKMAPFAEPYLTLVFPHPEWGGHAADYASDFHPFGAKEQRWTFEVRAKPIGSKVFLSWEGSTEILKHSRLMDVATGNIILPTDARWTQKGYPIKLNAAVQSYTWQYLGHEMAVYNETSHKVFSERD